MQEAGSRNLYYCCYCYVTPSSELMGYCCPVVLVIQGRAAAANERRHPSWSPGVLDEVSQCGRRGSDSRQAAYCPLIMWHEPHFLMAGNTIVILLVYLFLSTTTLFLLLTPPPLLLLFNIIILTLQYFLHIRAETN